MNTIKSTIEDCKKIISQDNKQEAIQLVLMLLEHVLKISYTHVLAYQDEIVKNSDYNKIIELAQQLKNDKPIQYLLGETEFYGLLFKVSKSVLIPRPETEELVDLVLKNNKKENPLIVDLGTGSGCISIALNHNLPQANVVGVDFSAEAIDIAKQNNILNKTNVDFLKFDVLNDETSTLPQNTDILISNPPYVTNKQKQEMEANVLNYEPHSALFVPDENPLIFYKKIADIGKQILTKKGLLFFEINEIFGKETSVMLSEKGYVNVSLHKDINGKDRMIMCQYGELKND